jgi:MFS family permease
MLTTALFGISFGAFYAFLPLLAERRGFEPVGLAYTVYGGSIILTRLLTANLLDLPDRSQVLVPALLVTTVGLVGFAFAENWALLLVSAALMAAGSGVAHPALIALCVDRMPDDERGRATASFYLAFDLGIGMGNWLLGPVLGSFGLQGMYLLAAGIGLVGVATARWIGKGEAKTGM